MSEAFDLSKLKDGKLPPEAHMQNVPNLGQQVPVLPGISVNNQMVTIYDLMKFSEPQFREFVLAVLVHMGGAVYSPPPPPSEEVEGNDTEAAEAEAVAEPTVEQAEPDPED